MKQSYFIKQPNTTDLTTVSFSQRRSRQSQVYLAILLGRAAGGAISNKTLRPNCPRTKLQRTALSYMPQDIRAARTWRSPPGILTNAARGRFANYVYFSTSKFGVVASSQVGISRLVWFTLLRLVRAQKLNLLQKKSLACRYGSHLGGYFTKLKKLEGFRNWIMLESSNIHFILNKTYRWLHHAFRFFQKHKRNLQSVSSYKTVRMGRCFLTPFLMRKFSRVKTIRKFMTFSFREWKRYYRNMRNILSKSAVRSVLWNTIGGRGLSKLGTYVRKSQMLKLSVPKSTVEAVTFNLGAYNPLVKQTSSQTPSSSRSQGVQQGAFKNFLSIETSKAAECAGRWGAEAPSLFLQRSKKNALFTFKTTNPSRRGDRRRFLRTRTEGWYGLKPFDRPVKSKHLTSFKETLGGFIKKNRFPKGATGKVEKLLGNRLHWTSTRLNARTKRPAGAKIFTTRVRCFAYAVAVRHRLGLLNVRKTKTNRELNSLLSATGRLPTSSFVEIRQAAVVALSFLLSLEKRMLLANQIALRILPRTYQLNHARHADLIGARVANKNKVKIFRQRFYKRRLFNFFKKWQFISRILQFRTLLFKPHWIMRKINRKSKTTLSFRTYVWMVKLFGYRYLFKINGRYRRMLFNSKKRKAKRKNATNPRGPQHLKFKYKNIKKKLTRKERLKRLFVRLSARGRKRFLTITRDLSAARSTSTAIRLRSRFLSARYVSLVTNVAADKLLKTLVLNNIGLPKKPSPAKPTRLVGRGADPRQKPLLHWQLPLMEQVRIRNREREERLKVQAALLERIRKAQEPFDLKKFQAEGFAKATANPALNTYRDVKILKYAYSGEPDSLKIASMLEVHRRQQKRAAEIKRRAAQKLKNDKVRFFKKSTDRRSARTLSLRARRCGVDSGSYVSATSPFAGSEYLGDLYKTSGPTARLPNELNKKFYKVSTHLKMVGSYRMHNLIKRRSRTKEKNLTLLSKYRRTKEKRKKPKIVWVVGVSSEKRVEDNIKPSYRVRRVAKRNANFSRFAYQKLMSGTRFLYQTRHFRYRKYLCFLEQSTLFQYLSRYCIYKMGLVRGVWQKLLPTSRKTPSALGLRNRCRPYRPFGVRLNQYTLRANASIGIARARQKSKLKRAIFYTNNKIYVHNFWESTTRVYPSFGYFRKLRLERRRERLMLKNRTKPLRFDVFNRDLGAYWGPRVLKVRTLVLRKMRASLTTDNMSQCIYWKKAIQFFYTNRFLKGFKQKRVRVPQGLPYLMVSKLMPNIKRLRTILKEEIKIMKLKRVKLFPKFLYARKRTKSLKETPYEYRTPNFRFAALRFLQNGKRRLPPYWHRTRKKKFPLKSQKKDWTKSMGFWYSPARARRESVTYLEGSVSYRPGKYSIALTRVLERFNLERELSLMLKFRKNKPLIFLPYVHYVQWWRYHKNRFETTVRRRVHLYGLRGRGSKKIWFGKSKVSKGAVRGLRYYSQILEVQNRATMRGRMGGLNSTMTSFNIIMGKFYSRLQNLNDYSTTLAEVGASTRSTNPARLSKNILGHFRYNVTFNRTVHYDKVSLFRFTNSVFRLYTDLFASANSLLSRYPDKAESNLFGRRLVLSLLNYSMYSKNAYFVAHSGGVSERSLMGIYVRSSKNLSVIRRLNTGLLFSRAPVTRLNHLKIRYTVPSRKNILVKYIRGLLASKTIFRNIINIW